MEALGIPREKDTHTGQQQTRRCAPRRGKLGRLRAQPQQEERETSAVWAILEGFAEEVRFLHVGSRH